MHIRLPDYYGQDWNGKIIDNFKNELSKWKNDKRRLKNIFQPPRQNISLFLNAVKHDTDFAAYLIQFAIDHNVDSNILLDPVRGVNPLHVAVREKNYQLVEMILKFAAGQRTDIRSMNIIFTFGLEKVIDERNCLKVMRAIVTLAKDNGVDVELLFRADDEGKTPIHLAACKKYFYWVDSVIKLAKEYGICAKSLFGPNATGNTPLHHAAKNTSATSVDGLLNFATDSGVDVAGLFQPNDERRTPLHCAAMNESDNTFESVLRWAKSCRVPLLQLIEADSDGRTPLHLFANNRTTTVKYAQAATDILRIALELNQLTAILKRDREGKTPLDYAAIKGNEGIVCAILQSVVQIDQEMVHVLLEPDKSGQTPLHLAAQEGKDEAARVIMQAAAEFGREKIKSLLATDERGDTPLQLALQHGSHITGEVIIRFALKYGVDWRTLIDIKDDDIRSELKGILYNQTICMPWIWSRFFPSQSSVAMSASTRSRNSERSNLSQLPDDVLFNIFEFLDGLDLTNCESVCHRWRKVLSRKIIWSKLHKNMSQHCITYRRFQEIVEQEDGEFVHCGSSEKCKMISRKLQELDTNWRTGNYQMRIESWDRDLHVRFKNNDDVLLTYTYSHDYSRYTTSVNQFRIINRRSMKLEREFRSPFNYVSDFQVHGNIIVIASDEFIRVFNATTAAQVNEVVVPNKWKVANLCLGHGLLVALSTERSLRESSLYLPKSRQLTVWCVNSATDIEHLVDLSIAGDKDRRRRTSVIMDERYIAVFLETWQHGTKVYFVSTQSWTILEQSPTITDADGYILHYHRGLLIILRKNSIQLKDVCTEDCREINLEPLGLSSIYTLNTKIRTNSKYLVVMNQQAEWTKVVIMRLTSGCDTPLCCFNIPMKVESFEMDETELICVGAIRKIDKHIMVIDFLPTPPNMELRRTASSGSLLNGEEISWRFTLAKEIHETLTSFNGV